MRARMSAAAAVVAVLLTVLPAWLAASPSLASTVGPSRPVVAGLATTLTLGASPAELLLGEATTLRGRLTDTVTGSGVTGATVFLEGLAPDGSWAVVAGLSTDAGGAVTSVQAPPTSSLYRLRHGDPGSVEASTSPTVRLTVATLTAALSRESVPVGRPVTVSGAVAPVGGAATVRLERLVDGRWIRAGRTTTGPDGSYSIPVTPTAPGFWHWRVLRGSGGAREVSTLPALDAYRLHRYSVSTRGTVRASLAVFRASVAATYADPRGWLRAHHRFRPVGPGGQGELTVVLSQAEYLPAYSSVCSTSYSCRVGRFVIINQDRWRTGSPYFPGSLAQYRAMVVNHETGHWLGRGHAYCSGPRELAPVMQQQSKGLHGCRVNPWPLPPEIRAVT